MIMADLKWEPQFAKVEGVGEVLCIYQWVNELHTTFPHHHFVAIEPEPHSDVSSVSRCATTMYI